MNIFSKNPKEESALYYMEYPLEWLDQLIVVSLDPRFLSAEYISADEAETILARIKSEELKLQLLIKSQTFALATEEDVAVCIRRYNSSLFLLMDKALKNQQLLTDPNESLTLVFKALIDCLDNLLSFIKEGFSIFLSPEERVPATYLAITKEELRRKMEKLKLKISPELLDKPALKMLLKRLESFIKTERYRFEVTFRAVDYIKELQNKLDEMDWEKPVPETCKLVHELLINMNFNSKLYIKLLTGEIRKIVDNCVSDPERLDTLLLYSKDFNQLQSKPGAVLNPKYHHLQEVLRNWFDQEIGYLDKKNELSVQENQIEQAYKEQHQTAKEKLLCKLSSDQLGLFIRALDEARIVVARSMNAVFKQIVPFLSTVHREHLSIKAMQNKTYAVEERDKEIVIAYLEKLIKIIKGY